MAKATWDKVIHAAPTIDNRLTEDVWHKFTDTTVKAPAGDYEPRIYNPSGPFYGTTQDASLPPAATQQPVKE